MKQTAWIFPFLALIAALMIATFARANAAQDRLSDQLVRFHVIANSELAWDQEIKYKVRDAVVAKAEALTRTAKDAHAAQEVLSANLPELEKTANAVLLQQGARYTARASLRHEYFPTKSYAGFRLPAGDYDAVSITLGAGKGRNFWCVLFPPLCVAPVSVTETALTDNEIALITEDGVTTEYRFLLMELAGKTKHAIMSKWN